MAVKFICDDNLGKLAGYLRILGFDTLFEENIDNNRLLSLASGEERALLSRDRKLSSRSHPYGLLILEDDDPLVQLSMVIQKLDLTINPEAIFTRCSKCNSVCENVPGETLSGKVFPFIIKTQEIIRRCPSCGRFYWKGSHYKALLTRLRAVIDNGRINGTWPGEPGVYDGDG